MATDNGAFVSDADIALYDRQIRLWGFDAQRRLQSGQVLLVELTGVQTEIAKNLVLAGVGHVTLLGNHKPQPRHLATQFLVRCEDDGAEPKSREEEALPRLHELNPRVDIHAETGSLFDGRDLESFLSRFQLVCLSSVVDFTQEQLEQLDDICRRKAISFVIADVAGMLGFSIIDTDGHRFGKPDSLQTWKCSSLPGLLAANWTGPAYRQASPLLFAVLAFLQAKKRGDDEELQQLCLAKGLTDARKLPTELYARLAATIGREFSPVCAILGGIVGQEIITILSGQEEPLPNVFLYNGLTGDGINYSL